MSISISGSGGITGATTSYSFDQSVSIGGTLTYEDVTNIDSVGVITARDGLDTPTDLVLRTGGTEQARIDSSGNVLIGGTLPASPNITLNADGTAVYKNAVSVDRATTDNSFGLMILGNSNNSAGAASFVFKGDKCLIGTDVNVASEAGANITLNANGSASFVNQVTTNTAFIADSLTDSVTGQRGQIYINPKASANIFVFDDYATGSKATKFNVARDGSVTFAGYGVFGSWATSTDDVNSVINFAGGAVSIVRTSGTAPSSGVFSVYTGPRSSSSNKTIDFTAGGSATFAGALSKGSGSFKIDHPLPTKTETHHLVHSFIEGPQADLIYSGMVTLVAGRAEINLDTAARMTEGTFLLLNTNLRRFVSNEGGWTAVKSTITGNILTVEAQDNTCTDEVFWTVIGERKDQHMIDTEWTDENGRVITEPLKS